MESLQIYQMFTLLLLCLALPTNTITVTDTHSWLFPRATCQYLQVKRGEGCDSLAKRCSVSQADLVRFNGGGDFCSHLIVDQYVCCSTGTLPDFSPQPGSDGNCKVYSIKQGDTCDSIATSNKMTVSQLRDRNKKTWGFAGCNSIYPGQKICLSAGRQPMPATIPNAVCGPQKNDTRPPDDISKLADLNPCPLNACCDKWGQCGITSEYCTQIDSETGAPGTSAPGTNGCISNCGTDVVNQGNPPTSFMRLGYYEAFSVRRRCLTMRPSQIPKGYYTHLVCAS